MEEAGKHQMSRPMLVPLWQRRVRARIEAYTPSDCRWSRREGFCECSQPARPCSLVLALWGRRLLHAVLPQHAMSRNVVAWVG